MSALRRFASARADEAVWLLAMGCIAMLTLVQLAVFGGLWCLAWLADHVTGREA
jgi:hypothetical protein